MPKWIRQFIRIHHDAARLELITYPAHSVGFAQSHARLTDEQSCALFSHSHWRRRRELNIAF
jgi:calcineurin-like phosphoesterase family protein